MPLIFTREYIIGVIVSVFVTLLVKRRGLDGIPLWLISTTAIIVTLWFFGIHPLGFIVSVGGWLMFASTVLIGWAFRRLLTESHDERLRAVSALNFSKGAL